MAATQRRDLRLAGRVELDLRADHAGVAVTLNDGEAVAVTDSAGAYTFNGLAPGAYAVKAQFPGFRIVELPGVVLTEQGDALGLVDVFMSPGQDDQVIDFPVGEGEGEGEGEPAEPPTLEIVFPGPNNAFLGGAPIVLAAANVVWSLANQFGEDGVEFDVRGATIVADLPIVNVETFVTVIASVVGDDGSTAGDSVIIRVQPPVVAEVQAEASLLGDGLPDGEPLIEGGELVGVRLRVEQGHPADVRPADGLTAIWTDGGGSAFQDTIPVSSLPVGTHRFAGVVTTGDGQTGNVVVEVVVSALSFEVNVVETQESIDYFTDTGLPLRATVTHGWQTAFLAQSATWRLPTGRVVGNGLTTTAAGVEAGLDVVTLEVADLAGNRRTVTVPFALEAIAFSAFFNAPTTGSVLQQGTPVRVNVDFLHNRLSDAERAAAFVQVTSSIQGALSSAGSINLAPATDLNFDLSEGTHTLTARVFAGGRIAQASTTVTVQAKFVSSTLIQPVRACARPRSRAWWWTTHASRESPPPAPSTAPSPSGAPMTSWSRTRSSTTTPSRSSARTTTSALSTCAGTASLAALARSRLRR